MDPMYVTLDAEAIVSANFQYESGRLDRLAEYVDSGRIKVVMSEVTVREVDKKIADSVQEADQAARRFRDKARILRNATDPSFASVFEEFDCAAITGHLQQQWHDYLENVEAEVLPVDQVRPSAVFDRYFEGVPPFGEGRKKAEFPDAFAAAAVEQWATTTKRKVIIVSADPDLRAAAEQSAVLDTVERIDGLLEILATQDDHIAPLAAEALWAKLPDLEDSIRASFTELGFYLSDREGEVDEVRVIGTSWSELHVTQVDGGNVHFGLRGTVEYEADVDYEDLSTAVWDNEDKRYMFIDTVRSTVTREEDIELAGTAWYRMDEKVSVEVTSFHLENGDIGVQVEHWLDVK